MSEALSRTQLLLGETGMDRLAHARVAVFGLGGVGGYVVEALARSGIGALDLIDDDTISESNLNRQILALHSTVGMAKVDAAANRVRDINPDITLRTYRTFFTPDTADQFDFSAWDYVVDAIDTVSGKLELVCRAHAAGVPVISCMGTGNKLDPSLLEVADIGNTSMCPLARVMRKELKKRGIHRLKVVYSKESPIELGEAGINNNEGEPNPLRKGSPKKTVPGSTAFVPPAAGLLLASEVVKDLSGVGDLPRRGMC